MAVRVESMAIDDMAKATMPLKMMGLRILRMYQPVASLGVSPSGIMRSNSLVADSVRVSVSPEKMLAGWFGNYLHRHYFSILFI